MNRFGPIDPFYVAMAKAEMAKAESDDRIERVLEMDDQLAAVVDAALKDAPTASLARGEAAAWVASLPREEPPSPDLAAVITESDALHAAFEERTRPAEDATDAPSTDERMPVMHWRSRRLRDEVQPHGTADEPPRWPSPGLGPQAKQRRDRARADPGPRDRGPDVVGRAPRGPRGANAGRVDPVAGRPGGERAPVRGVRLGRESEGMMNTGMDAELARSKRAILRRKASKTVVFQKVCKGLYISHEHGMSLSHELVWNRDAGRKWELTFHLSHMGIVTPSKHSKKFDTIKEARAYANALVSR